MNPKGELAELVMDHLTRGGGDIVTGAFAATVTGLASILSAYQDAMEKKGNWSTMLGNLRSGVASIEPSLPILREKGGPGIVMLVEFADRQLRFAALMQDEIIRLSAGESTLA